MSIIVKAEEGEGKTFELVPADNHVATCYLVADMGTVVDKDQKTGEDKKLHKVLIGWEIPGEMRTFSEDRGEQPMVINKEYNVFFTEKANLRKHLEAWRGRAFSEQELQGFDITGVIGTSCMLNVVHQVAKSSGNEYAKVDSVAKLPKEIPPPARINNTLLFDFNENFENLEKLPAFFQNKIKESPEYKQKIGESI